MPNITVNVWTELRDESIMLRLYQVRKRCKSKLKTLIGFGKSEATPKVLDPKKRLEKNYSIRSNALQYEDFV